jgi:predicted Zn finger-like uncharacterized protein
MRPIMRLVCPHCDALYDVPPSLLPGRRTVRCARCSGKWVEQGETPAVAIAPPIAPPEVPIHAPPPPQEAYVASSRPSASAARFGWAGSVLLLGLGAWSAVAWRSDVMRAWPPSGRLYSALGLAAIAQTGSSR